MPKRIHIKYTKGWRLPEGAVIVDRPGVWGSPLKVVGHLIYIAVPVGRRPYNHWAPLCDGDAEKMVRIFRYIITGKMDADEYGIELKMFTVLVDYFKYFAMLDWGQLQGHDLACRCDLSLPCHVDVLLEYANNNTPKYGL